MKKDELYNLIELCHEHQLTIVSDEVYEDLIFDQKFFSPLEIPGLADRTVVVSSISKSYAAPGFRSGWVLGPENFISKMLPLAETMLFGNQPFIADMTAYAISNKSQTAKRMKADYKRRAELICDKLSNIEEITPLMPKSGMFILLRINSRKLSAEQFAWRLLKNKQVAVMPGSSFGENGKNYVRVSLTVSDELIETACDKIKEFLESIKEKGTHAPK